MDNSLYFAISSLVVPIVIGVLMGLYPEFRAFGWAVIGICAGVFAASTVLFFTNKFQTYFTGEVIRSYLAGAAGVVGAFLVLATMLFCDPASYRGIDSPSTPLPLATGIRLQFFGDKRIPQEVDSKNIASWFAYFTASIAVTPQDAHGNPMAGGFEVPPNWVIYLTLDKPASYKQVIVSFSNPSLMPVIDYQQANSRAIMVSTRGQMPAGVLDIHVVQ